MNKISGVSNKAELNAGELKQVSGGNDLQMISCQSGLDEMYEIIKFNNANDTSHLRRAPINLPPYF